MSNSTQARINIDTISHKPLMFTVLNNYIITRIRNETPAKIKPIKNLRTNVGCLLPIFNHDQINIGVINIISKKN
jgi:hypothetical protein